MFYENQTKMSILSKPSDFKNFPFALKVDLKKNFSENLKNSNSFKQLSNVEILKQYESSARCAVFLSLFNVFPMLSNPMVLKKSDPGFNNSSITDASNNTLVYAITDAIRHPTLVVQVALNYIRDVFNSSMFIGIHWQYDKKDWINICKKPYAMKFCEQIWKIEPSHLIKMIRRKYKNEKVQLKKMIVYLAVPPSANDFKVKFYEELSTDAVFVKPKINITSYILNKYKLCLNTSDSTWLDTLPNFVSLCEMELMLQSSWFFFSTHSTWSNVVRLSREVQFQSFKKVNNSTKWTGNVGMLAVQENNETID